jgi:UDP-N-acetylglucosamine 2-epimerase
MKKIVTVVGARPQFIKVAPVSRVLRKKFREILVNTGQHYDYRMAGIFFEELNIPRPDFNLGLGSGTHGKQTGEMLTAIEDVLLSEKPDAVLVYGDTNSTLAGALAASKLHVPLFHVEAGLRSFNKRMPEEINRVLTDHMSDLLFSPTNTAIRNLSNEGINENVYNVGDVMYDAFLYNLKIAVERHNLIDYGLEEKSYILATIHRAENTDNYDRLKAIFESFNNIGELVVLPLHPRTEKMLKEYKLDYLLEDSTKIKKIEPLSYLEMLLLEKHSTGIVTDSGGVQKEAYFSNVPCYTIRDQTEWVETIEAGYNQLVNPLELNLKEIVRKTEIIDYNQKLYGDGNSSEKIVDLIENHLG